MNEEIKKMYQVFNLTGEAFWQAVLQMQAYLGEALPTEEMKNTMQLSEVDIKEYRCFRLTPKGKNGEKKVMHIHGGAYFMGNSPLHWKWSEKIVKETAAELWLPQYPLTPQHSCEQALEILLAVYEKMLEETEGKQIIIMGDSAGGGLALSLAMLIREKGLPQPKELIMISPSVDLKPPEKEEDKKYLEELAKKDSVLASGCLSDIANKWRGRLDISDYRVSPARGSLHDLGHMTVFTGTADILNRQARALKKAASQQNIPLRYWEADGKGHCWLMMEQAEEEFNLIKRIILE